MKTVSPDVYAEPAWVAPREDDSPGHSFEHDSKWQVLRKNLRGAVHALSSIHISEPTRIRRNSDAGFCLTKKKKV